MSFPSNASINLLLEGCKTAILVAKIEAEFIPATAAKDTEYYLYINCMSPAEELAKIDVPLRLAKLREICREILLKIHNQYAEQSFTAICLTFYKITAKNPPLRLYCINIKKSQLGQMAGLSAEHLAVFEKAYFGLEQA